MLVNKQYVNGQTDGMKLYKKELKNDIRYTFATNSKDAAMKFKAKITISYHDVSSYLKQIF